MAFRQQPQTPSQSQLVKGTLELNESLIKSKRHFIWGCFNSVIVAILIFDIFQKQNDGTFGGSIVLKCELLVAIVFGINTLFHFIKYTVTLVSRPDVILSPTQRKLIGVPLPDKYVKTLKQEPEGTSGTSPKEPEYTATFPMNLSSSSWLSPQALSEADRSANLSHNLSSNVSSSSWFSSSPVQAGGSPTTFRMTHNSDGELIRDEQALRTFLEQSKAFADLQDLFDQSGGHEGRNANVVPSFCSSSQSLISAEVSPLLRRCAYQIATLSPVAGCSSPGTGEEGVSPLAGPSGAELWRRLHIDSAKLTQWNANLRMWISLTILQRLVKELEVIDSALLRCGLSDLRVGSVGLDRLKKTAMIPQVVASIPSLPRLVSFLELSPHQEYLVTRIRELAKGGSMSEFRWSSGGSLNGKSWEEHLPTDAALIMHLMATYLDLQILPSAHRPDTRPFSSQHLVRSPEKPSSTTATAPVIYQQQLNPPHFMLVDKNDVLDVPKGRNNVFYCLLVFLHILKTREHGMLGPLNLGRSGLNVLWVLDS